MTEKLTALGVAINKLLAEKKQLETEKELLKTRLDNCIEASKLCSKEDYYKELKAELKTELDCVIGQLEASQKDYTKANRQIQSLTAKLEDARQGNRNLSALLGKAQQALKLARTGIKPVAQKRASKTCAIGVRADARTLESCKWLFNHFLERDMKSLARSSSRTRTNI